MVVVNKYEVAQLRKGKEAAMVFRLGDILAVTCQQIAGMRRFVLFISVLMRSRGYSLCILLITSSTSITLLAFIVLFPIYAYLTSSLYFCTEFATVRALQPQQQHYQ
ncbi:hypothetical protein D917_00792 [Trichinella nativa]|uniref:Uncharacterized protein n=1 Tax=Trichinella nativa TaxID=6335 RepID=A0A1Y3E8W9_9BILA|nr:hypothetical protein D917_00792 [Trichinella nativa]